MGGMATYPVLNSSLIHSASVLFWQLGPQQFQRNCTPCVLWKAWKTFKYLNGKLHGASCSQTILDTDSSLSKPSKTMSLRLKRTRSTPWNRAGPAQLWFTLLWSTLRWDDGLSLQTIVIKQQLLHRAQDGLKSRWVETLLSLYFGKQHSDAVTASCIWDTLWVKFTSPSIGPDSYEHASEELWTAGSLSSLPLHPQGHPSAARLLREAPGCAVHGGVQLFQLHPARKVLAGTGGLGETLLLVLWSCRAALWSQALK